MPNPVAYLALALWPVVCLVLMTRLPRERGIILSILLGYLFLPEPPAVFDFPAMPPFGKHNIPALTVFAFCLWRFGMAGSMLPQSVLGRVLVVVFILSPVGTVLTNGEALVIGEVVLPGLRVRDMVALSVQQFLLLLPFLLARQFLASGGAQKELLTALVWTGLAYSVLMLIEIRLSPQLNNWIYGYYQHYFAQSIRSGGYRPVVFLYHGLWVAFFAFTALVAAWALFRNGPPEDRVKYLVAGLYLGVVMVLAKSLGALIFAVAIVPCVLILPRILQMKVAILIGALAMSYPLLKAVEMVPEQRLLERAASIDEERSYSLQFRFEQENLLLDRAYLKPVFGWGSWGRNHVRNTITGEMETISDGRWIILIGIYGWVGFLAEFGLLILPLGLLWRETILAKGRALSPYITPLSLLLAVNVFDLLPNATLTSFTWLLAGALTGYAETLKARRLNHKPDLPALKWQSIL